ncbi:hypothetical protein A2U01_0098734, partial [Trifolium medium]|nr:hypothetical protein [Trifolium medium]
SDDLTAEVLKDLDKLVEKNMMEVDNKIGALD